MRVASAGSCATILWSEAAVDLGSSTVLTILAVTSGRVERVVTFFRASATRVLVCGEVMAVVIGACSRELIGKRGAALKRRAMRPTLISDQLAAEAGGKREGGKYPGDAAGGITRAI